MATIVTRAGKGTPLTNTEVDANFTNLNSDKLETSAVSTFGASLIDDVDAPAARTTLGLGTAATTNATDYVGKTSSTGSAVLPAGTTAERDATPLAGFFRFSTTTKSPEYYSGVSWVSLVINAVLAGLSQINDIGGRTSGFVRQTAENVFKNINLLSGTGVNVAVVTADGDYGFSADFATQAEAEAGITPFKVMNPLRVAQAIDALAGTTVLLGTLTTTSGTTQTLSGLDLTVYNVLYITYSGVSFTFSREMLLGGIDCSASTPDAASTIRGYIRIDLNSSVQEFGSVSSGGTSDANSRLLSPYNKSSTSITFSINGSGNFDAGSILVYGVK